MSIVSCTFMKPVEDSLLAEVYGAKLYKTDVENIVPAGLKAIDSTRFIEKFVKKWTQTQCLVHKAEDKLDKSKDDFEFEINQYYNELLVHLFNEKHSLKNVPTEVSKTDVLTFYNKHKDAFPSMNTFLKVDYVVLDRKSKLQRNLYKYLTSGTKRDSLKFVNVCARKKITINNLHDSWITLDHFKQVIPIEISDPSKYFKSRKYTKLYYQDKVYLIRFFDVVIKGGVAPLEFSKDKISRILYNKRKSEFINEFEQKIYKEGIKNKNIIIYTN